MPKPRVTTAQPKSVWTKPLNADWKALFKGLAKGVGHTVAGKWVELGSDAVESLCAIGITTEPGELAFALIQRSIIKALFDLVGENASQLLIETNLDEDSLIEHLDLSSLLVNVEIDPKFFDRPSDLSLVRNLEAPLRDWLHAHGVGEASAKAITDRMPSYFVYALNEEWRRNTKSYAPLLETIDTPFTRAGEREWAWFAYSALLEKRVSEGVFDEPFSLAQIFVPLNAYYIADPSRPANEIGHTDRHPRHVVSLEEELEKWLQGNDRNDAVRVISGGPGSGKSSFARIFAARLAKAAKPKVLFIPLHLIDAGRDLVEEVGRFVKEEGVLFQNPLDPDSPEANLLLILDGLDELASQGKAAAETARAFVREVERTAEKRNGHTVKLRVLVSGRELVVQENQSEFRRPRQVLSLLPYFVPLRTQGRKLIGPDDEEYIDEKQLLKTDLRNTWWQKYGILTGRQYPGLPPELRRPDLIEITAQPLLNYLVALSFTRDKINFAGDVNLNSIYGDLVGAVYERGYERHRPYAHIRQMRYEDFLRVLEEIGLAAWHGDGRSTTVREIEEHCQASGVGILLKDFQEGAKAGVTRLLAAFFFRQHGRRPTGDPTFVFTHKSFGEYLAALRIARAVERIVRYLEQRSNSPDEGWDEKEALRHWG